MFICETCNHEFSTKFNLTKHLNKTNKCKKEEFEFNKENGIYFCNKCDYKTNDKGHMRRHYNNTIPCDKPVEKLKTIYTCTCGFTNHTKSKLLKHLNRKNNQCNPDKIFTDENKETYITIEEFNKLCNDLKSQNDKNKEESKKHKCTTCGYETNDKSHYNRHIKNDKCKPPAKEGYKICSKCNEEKTLDNFNKDNSSASGIRSYCKQCQNNNCPHGVRKSECKKCKGSQICEHNKNKSRCKECKSLGTGGSQICEHNKRKSQCKLCNGTAFCEHGKQKHRCKECDGSSICEHGNDKYFCKQCKSLGIGGKGICEHDHVKHSCLQCPKTIIPSAICKGCGSTYLSKARINTNTILCKMCEESYGEKMERIEEVFAKLIIEEVGFEATTLDTTFVNGNKCKDLERRRPDMTYIIPNKVAVVIEIDEDSHFGYEPKCELSKISQQNSAIQRTENCENIQVYTIRVNPNNYDTDFEEESLKDRACMVGNKVKEILNFDHYDKNGFQKVLYYYYHSKSKVNIEECVKHFDIEIY